VLLQGDRYNVTTTNLVPRTYEMVATVGADAIVIDLTIGEPQIWSLLEQLSAGERTRSLPIVVTARDPDLLRRAERQPWRAGSRFLFLEPFDTDALADAVHALVGPA
jgi:DNA-binding response OmpR family regulator